MTSHDKIDNTVCIIHVVGRLNVGLIWLITTRTVTHTHKHVSPVMYCVHFTEANVLFAFNFITLWNVN